MRLIELLLAVVQVDLLCCIVVKLGLQLNGSPASLAARLQNVNASTLVSCKKKKKGLAMRATALSKKNLLLMFCEV